MRYRPRFDPAPRLRQELQPKLEESPLPKLRLNWFGRIARAAAMQPWLTVLSALLMTSICAGLLLAQPPDLRPWLGAAVLGPRQASTQLLLEREFPGYHSTIVIAAESDQPARARAVAGKIANELRGRPELYSGIFAPGTGSFFETYGLFYLDAVDIERSVAEIERKAPLFEAIAAAPTLEGFASLTDQVSKVVAEGRSPDALDQLFAEAAKTVESVIKGGNYPLDWTSLVDIRPRLDDNRWFVLASLTPGGVRAVDEARRIIADIRASEGQSVKVDLTGQAIMADGLARSSDRLSFPALVISGVFLCVVLFVGTGNWRIAVSVLVSILPVAILALAIFAPAGISQAQALSSAPLSAALVASVYFAVRYEAHLGFGFPGRAAMALAAQDAMPLILLAPLVPLAGAFLGHDFPAFAMAASACAAAGLVAALLCLTLLPAIFSILPVFEDEVGEHWIDHALRSARAPRLRQVGFGLAAALFASAIAAAAAVPRIGFSPHPPQAAALEGAAADIYEDLARRDPALEFAAQATARSFEEARDLYEGLSALPEVKSIRWIGSFLPADSAAKHATLARLRGLFPTASQPVGPRPPDQLAGALSRLQESLRAIANAQSATPALTEAAHLLRRGLALIGAQSTTSKDLLPRLENAMFSGFPAALKRVEQLPELAPLTVETLDPQIRNRFLSGNGVYRLEIAPKSTSGDDIQAFARAVESVAPDAAGKPMAGAAGALSMRWATLIACAGMLIFHSFAAVAALWRPIPVMAAVIGFASSMLLVGGGIFLSGVPLMPRTVGPLLILAYFGSFVAIVMAAPKRISRVAARAVLVSGFAIVAIALPLWLLPQSADAEPGLIGGWVALVIMAVSLLVVREALALAQIWRPRLARPAPDVGLEI